MYDVTLSLYGQEGRARLFLKRDDNLSVRLLWEIRCDPSEKAL